MASTSSSSSSSRYILQSGGDEYTRWELPKFRGPRYLFKDGEDDFNQDSDSTPNTTSKPTHIIRVQSVVENVQVLEKALQEHAIGQNPFGEAWQNAMPAYAQDLERRNYPMIFEYSAVGVFRESTLNIAIRAASSSLKNFVTTNPSLQDEPLIPGHGWVFFLLETHLGLALQRSHGSMPDDDEDVDDEVVQQKLNEVHESFAFERSLAMESIKRIRSSRQHTQKIQYFKMSGEQLEYMEHGLSCKETESAKETSRIPGDHGTQDELLAVLSRAVDRTSSHDVVVDIGKEGWELVSGGMGAGYVSWKVEDAVSGHHLLGFSEKPRG